MENNKKLLELCKKNYSKKETQLIEKSLEFIKHHLEGEKISGKSLTEFNTDVGEILANSKLSAETIVAGILYGIEKIIPFKKVVENFGEEIAEIVFGQLQLRMIKKNNASVQAELVRKILLTGLDDIRIIFVKLAVKLANLRIISALKEKEQKRIAEDILTLYVPLATRLGLDYIKNNLEDLAFKTTKPKKYEEISNFFKESKKEREEFIKKFINKLKNNLSQKVGLIEIKGRNKQIKSIFDKITKREVALKEQKDHYAIRIIVENEKDCYSVLGILHEEFIPIAGRLKDYVNSPKPNGYQSIHTVLKIPSSGEEIEVQIRTEKMDEFAEEGNAAHWSYKKVEGDTSFEKKVGWLKALIKFQKGSSNKEFIKNLKLDLFADKIYCYTPKGDAKELPKNATLLDFAYYIHQEVGERAVGGRVNGKFVSLKETLKNGCVVEILTNKNQRPRRDWLKFVISAKAKSKIRQGIRRYESIPVPHKQTIEINNDNDFDNLVESHEFPSGKFSFAKCCYPLPKD
ncbi:MAG: HD domain-containing protein, partial [Nanoarchaeota archaeon]|nr:HD domain-containing protein [Nanoarchaeota archaeon]